MLMRNVYKIATLVLSTILLNSIAYATTYYAKNTGDWNNATTWVTGTCSSTMNATGSYPKAGDVAVLCNNKTVTIKGNESVQDISIDDGTLAFGNGANYTLTISGNLTLDNKGILEYTFNSGRQHTLSIGGSVTNEGKVDLLSDSNDYVSITFNGASNTVVSGGGQWRSLAFITLNKSTKNTVVDLQAAGFSNQLTTGANTILKTSVVLTRGTLKHNNTGTLGNVYEAGLTKADVFHIPYDVVLQVSKGVVDNPSTESTYLNGKIIVDGGTLNITSGSTFPTYEGLLYTNTTNYAELYITSGNLTIGGGFTNQGNSLVDFNMSGGTMNISTNGTTGETFYLVSNCIFNMSGGTIIIHNKSNYSHPLIGPKVDFSIWEASTYNVTGGIIQFGGTSSTTAQTFRLDTYSESLPNIVLAGPIGKAATLVPYDGVDIKMMSLEINTGNTFDIRDTRLLYTDSKKLIITSTNNGSYAFSNSGTFTARTSTVILNGADQSISGSTATNFYNLTINNITALLPATTTFNTNATVANTLTMLNGLISLNSNTLTLGTSAASTGTLAYTSGWMEGGTFTRFFSTTTIADGTGTTKGFFPMGTKTDARSFYLSAPTTAPTTGGSVSISHTSTKKRTPVSFPDGMATVLARRDDPWSVTSNLVGGTYNLVAGGTGFPGIGNIANLRLTLNTSVVGTAGTNAGTNANPRVQRTSLSAGQLSNNFFISSVDIINSPLPVELTAFYADPLSETITIFWTTASEKNNASFEVLKSTDGITFSTIATIEGKGNSNTTANYETTDAYPLNGTSYYQLKQIDYDGHINYSSIISVEWSTSGFQIYPSPVEANQSLHILIPTSMSETHLKLTTLYGDVVFEKTIQPSTQSELVEINCVHLSSGIYIVNSSNGTNQWKKKIIIK
jgi:hypothetical protein